MYTGWQEKQDSCLYQQTPRCCIFWSNKKGTSKEMSVLPLQTFPDITYHYNANTHGHT